MRPLPNKTKNPQPQGEKKGKKKKKKKKEEEEKPQFVTPGKMFVILFYQLFKRKKKEVESVKQVQQLSWLTNNPSEAEGFKVQGHSCYAELV